MASVGAGRVASVVGGTSRWTATVGVPRILPSLSVDSQPVTISHVVGSSVCVITSRARPPSVRPINSRLLAEAVSSLGSRTVTCSLHSSCSVSSAEMVRVPSLSSAASLTLWRFQHRDGRVGRHRCPLLLRESTNPLRAGVRGPGAESRRPLDRQAEAVVNRPRPDGSYSSDPAASSAALGRRICMGSAHVLAAKTRVSLSLAEENSSNRPRQGRRRLAGALLLLEKRGVTQKRRSSSISSASSRRTPLLHTCEGLGRGGAHSAACVRSGSRALGAARCRDPLRERNPVVVFWKGVRWCMLRKLRP